MYVITYTPWPALRQTLTGCQNISCNTECHFSAHPLDRFKTVQPQIWDSSPKKWIVSLRVTLLQYSLLLRKMEGEVYESRSSSCTGNIWHLILGDSSFEKAVIVSFAERVCETTRACRQKYAYIIFLWVFLWKRNQTYQRESFPARSYWPENIYLKPWSIFGYRS